MLPRIRQHVRCRWASVLASAMRHGLRHRPQVADAVVIGSKIIQLIGDQPRDAGRRGGTRFLQGIRSALDSTIRCGTPPTLNRRCHELA
jgi:tryptophan synthase alpha chain